MEYRKFDQGLIVRLDPGEEIIEALTQLARQEDIALASISGLGAANEVIIGIFDTEHKTYGSKTYQGLYEIAALVGSLTRMDGAPYLHLHVTIGNPLTGEVHAGHMSRCVISATGEIFLQVWKGQVGRKFSDQIGLNLFDFEVPGK